ncbi:hypothetical protein NQ315_006267 [Exocentrus adspersus]|uniref:Brain-enriched guanylate kinase-associated protein n=1 Tax=Exocentrus adspersus TaxID=1586481 RepID=A0AAV8W0A6_9CUCU|nr:hypothetical protein NQ315_006267 [Exocentrus adspersus]
MANKCKECGCTCKRCISSDHDVQLHVEIENLKQRLLEKETHIVTMETNFLNEANKFPSGELVAVREELLTWQDKYKRLYEAHRRVQRVNQGLEDKLLKLVDVCETEKGALTKDVAVLSHKLAEANYAIKKLTDDNARYKNDVSLAIQFLQCKQSNFVAHKYDSLPSEVQVEVGKYMTNKRKPEEHKACQYLHSPPTAMVYSVPKSPRPEKKLEPDAEAPAVDIVSAAIMAKVLEERQKERALAKHCDTCTCAKNLKIIYESTHHSIGTQTGDYNETLCLRCNENMQLTSSGMKIVRCSDFKAPVSQEAVELATASNIVKVQPNNFLNDNKSSSQNPSPKSSNVTNPNKHVISIEFGINQDVVAFVDAKQPSVTAPEKAESEDNRDKRTVKDATSSSTRNILLDNAHGSIQPVLYTRSHKVTRQTPQDMESMSTSDGMINSMCSETSAQNQQRVAEWIQSNLDNEVSSSDNSRADSVKNKHSKMDKVKYAEMEENVKRFLFGESEFMRKVEIGKLKYQNLQAHDGASTGSGKKNSHTETDI